MLKPLHVIGLLLVILGAINWGVIGCLQVNLIGLLCGGASSLPSRAVYAVIGLAGLMLAAATITVYSHWRVPRFPRQ